MYKWGLQLFRRQQVMVGKLPGGGSHWYSHFWQAVEEGLLLLVCLDVTCRHYHWDYSIILLLGLVVYAYYCLSGRQRILWKISICRKIYDYFFISSKSISLRLYSETFQNVSIRHNKQKFKVSVYVYFLLNGTTDTIVWQPRSEF